MIDDLIDWYDLASPGLPLVFKLCTSIKRRRELNLINLRLKLPTELGKNTPAIYKQIKTPIYIYLVLANKNRYKHLCL